MKEREFNTIVARSFNTLGGFGFKIPDTFASDSYSRSKAPYDGYGYFNKHFVCWESKYLNSPSAFNFNNLKEHQINNLIYFYENIPDRCYSLFLIGVNFGRGDIRCFYWINDDLYKIKGRKNNKENILKKDFLAFDNYIKVKKGVLNFSEILV